ncbi:hypothetical protein DWX40_06510 [Bacteroides stercoris]|nr:hypothetical protein DWX40_06510 [Bacteroides stercoris]
MLFNKLPRFIWNLEYSLNVRQAKKNMGFFQSISDEYGLILKEFPLKSVYLKPKTKELKKYVYQQG